ncbi:unnamed protein product [Protopolystoma xenopodis]|uniref:Uncharacterized protein n=1 Tax=Protopolystoma xenopodis TaxID=117903 RepID=A0A448WNL7_9PLAT|nr:unnamed protein product [Protopolystoma xenopodis]
MDESNQGLTGGFVYIDDILVASYDTNQCKQHLQSVFGVDSLTFLRYRIDAHCMLQRDDFHLVTDVFDRAVNRGLYRVADGNPQSLAFYSLKLTPTGQRLSDELISEMLHWMLIGRQVFPTRILRNVKGADNIVTYILFNIDSFPVVVDARIGYQAMAEEQEH